MVSRSSRDDKFIASATSAPKFLKICILKITIKLWVEAESCIPPGHLGPWVGDVELGHGLGHQLLIQVNLPLGLAHKPHIGLGI